jgi:hypothetical protein
VRKYPPKSNIPPHFASISEVGSFRKVIARSALVQILARLLADSTSGEKSVQIQHSHEPNDRRCQYIFGSMIYFLIVSAVDGTLIVAKHGSIANRYIKFFEGIH